MSKQEQVLVFGKKIKIKYCDELDEQHGDFNLDKALIRVDSTNPEKIQGITKAHELLHACIGISGLTEILTTEQEEAIVRCIEHGFFPLVADSQLFKNKSK